MNRILIALIAIVVVGIPGVFTAGLTVALVFAANANPAEVIKTVIGSVGDWVSGLGALSAAVIAIYLADKQRKDSLPNIKITQDTDPYRFSIDIISVGDRSVLLTRVYLRSRHQSGQARLGRRNDFPKRLEFGDVYKITVEGSRYSTLSNFICGHDEQCDLPDLEIVVETSTGIFVVPADSSIIGLIEGTLTIYGSLGPCD